MEPSQEMKPSQENVEKVRTTLLRCIERFFRETAPRDERIRVDVTPTGEEVYQDDSRKESGAVTSLQFHLPDGTQRDGTFAVSHAGGNVYGVRVRVADGEERLFQLSVPDPNTWGPEEVQTSTDDVCRHVLSELERTRGKQQLEEATSRLPAGRLRGYIASWLRGWTRE